jgi:competence CoiA-like predicted nuclease
LAVDAPSANETMARVFCPKCGEEMVLKDGEVTCVSGNMGLS